jgi:hypothetical protein
VQLTNPQQVLISQTTLHQITRKVLKPNQQQNRKSCVKELQTATVAPEVVSIRTNPNQRAQTQTNQAKPDRKQNVLVVTDLEEGGAEGHSRSLHRHGWRLHDEKKGIGC